MSRENKQGSSEAQIRSVGERETIVVRSQAQRTRRSSFGAPKLSMAVTVEVPPALLLLFTPFTLYTQ